MPDTSTNLGLPLLVDSQAQKAATVNETFQNLDDTISGKLTIAMSDADYTVATDDALPGFAVYHFTGTLSTTRNVVVPNNTRRYGIINETNHSLVIKTSGGLGVIVVHADPGGSPPVPKVVTDVFCDGTDVLPVANA